MELLSGYKQIHWDPICPDFLQLWVPEKKQPRLGGKAYVGRLFPDGSVRPSKTFLERFPQYADKKLYYFENQLVDREGYLKLNPNAEAQWEELQSQEKTAEQQHEERRESIENDWRCTARQCGLTSAAWSFLDESDLLKDLEDMLGKEDARVIGALAVYMLDKGVSMNSFADWLGRVYIPGVQPICGQRLSELARQNRAGYGRQLFPETSSAGHNEGSGSQTGT